MGIPRHRLSVYSLLLAGITTFTPAAIRAAAPEDDAGPILAAVKAAVADGRVEQSRELGFNIAKKQFSEAPEDGGFLTGFDIGVGKFFDIENVYAVRAVYQTRHGDLRLQEHGLFRDKRLPNGKMLRTKVLRTVHIQARPGYAVGGLTVRSGLNINGLCVTFMKIDGNALDPTQAYTSDWVGDRTGGGEASVDGNGAPVVGVFGSQDDEHVSALGLTYATAPAAAFAPPAPARPADPPPVQPPPRPAELPRQNVPAAAPPQALPPEVRDDPVAAEPTVTPKKAVVSPAAEGWPLWAAVGIPVAVFAAVAAVIYLAVLIPFGRQARPVQGVAGRRGGARPPASPAISPSALCKAPRKAPRMRQAFDEQEVLELREDDFLPGPAAVEHEVVELREEDILSDPPDVDEPLLDALPVEAALVVKTASAFSPVPRPSGSWPRLEL